MCSGDGISSVVQARQAQTYAQIGIAVQAKALQATQVQGEAAVELLEVAAELAKQLGQGLQFDARA
ncbi:MAG: hypothetical protein JNL96_02940 [Planctomycetaceae bacterium]|nr:hypothetical protein [Planctomycetaceae bacterium]